MTATPPKTPIGVNNDGTRSSNPGSAHPMRTHPRADDMGWHALGTPTRHMRRQGPLVIPVPTEPKARTQNTRLSELIRGWLHDYVHEGEK